LAKDARGNPLLNTVDLKMCCDACIRRGLELSCKHMLGQLPHWQQRGRHDTIQRLMATEPDTFMVEMRGVVMDGLSQPAFDATAMRNLMTDPTFVWRHDGSTISHIFVALDPAAGGEQSEYAVVSAFYTVDDKLVICGAEAGKYREQRSCASLLINHIMALRRDIPGAASARIVFIPESNLGFEALWVTDEIRRSGLGDHWRVMVEDDNRAGVKVNRSMKHLMVIRMNKRLINGRVAHLAPFVSVGDSEHTPEEMRDRLLGQLKDFKRKVKPPRDPHHGQAVVSYSGKDGYGFDDLCMAFLLLDVMKDHFYRDAVKYGDFY
jgi:hypothetical protein